MTGLISVSALARRAGMSRRRMLTQLRALNHELHGTLLVQDHPNATVWVKQGVLEMIRQRDMNIVVYNIETRMGEAEARVASLETRVDEVEARCA